MNNRIWILATAILSIAVVAIGLVVGISPKFAESASAERARAGVEEQNALYAADLARLKAEFEDIDSIKDELRELQKSLPLEHGEERFIRQVDAAAASTAVLISDYLFDTPVLYASFDDSGAAAEGQAPIAGGTLLGIPVSVEVKSADLLALYAFIRPLQEGQRLYMLSSIAVTSESLGDAGYTYTMVVTGYVYTLADPDVETGEAPTTPAETPAPTETPTPTGTETPAATTP